jgi:hypothetical protein
MAAAAQQPTDDTTILVAIEPDGDAAYALECRIDPVPGDEARTITHKGTEALSLELEGLGAECTVEQTSAQGRLTFTASKGDGNRSTMSTGGQGSRITLRVR